VCLNSASMHVTSPSSACSRPRNTALRRCHATANWIYLIQEQVGFLLSDLTNWEIEQIGTQKGSLFGLAGNFVCSYPRDLSSRPGGDEIHRKVEFIETHRICVHMFPRSVPTRSRLCRARFWLGHRSHCGFALGGEMLCE